MISVKNAIADATSKCGSLEDTLLTAYTQSSEWEEALAMFFRMKKEGFKPNQFTFSTQKRLPHKKYTIGFRLLGFYTTKLPKTKTNKQNYHTKTIHIINQHELSPLDDGERLSAKITIGGERRR